MLGRMWEIVDLGVLEGDSSSKATSINNRGQVLGVSGGHAFLWTKGKLRDLGAFAGAGLNNRGDVALTSGQGSGHASLWRNGSLIDLGTIDDVSCYAGEYSEPVALNDRGEVLANNNCEPMAQSTTAFVWKGGKSVVLVRKGYSVGRALNSRGQVAGWVGDDVGLTDGRAFLWSDGRSTDLGALPGRQYSTAYALNDRGAVAGVSYDSEPGTWNPSRERAFLWRDGSMTDLGTLPGTNNSEAWAINDAGEVAGLSFQGDDSGLNDVFLWRNGTMTMLGTAPASVTDVLAINERGEVLGPRGVWRDGRFIGLTTLGGGRAGANAINDRGQVVGWSTIKAGKRHATLWTPRKG